MVQQEGEFLLWCDAVRVDGQERVVDHAPQVVGIGLRPHDRNAQRSDLVTSRWRARFGSVTSGDVRDLVVELCTPGQDLPLSIEELLGQPTLDCSDLGQLTRIAAEERRCLAKSEKKVRLLLSQGLQERLDARWLAIRQRFAVLRPRNRVHGHRR
jgi:hypothetical protein